MDIPPVRFGVLSLIGTLVYVVVLSSIGYSLGGEWTKFNHSFSVASYIVVAVVVRGGHRPRGSTGCASSAGKAPPARRAPDGTRPTGSAARAALDPPLGLLSAELVQFVHRDVGQAAVEDLLPRRRGRR